MRPLEDLETHDTSLWKGIWALKVLNKVKNHLWRACQNSLPTKTNLVRQTIIANDLCDRCHGAAKTMVHALWDFCFTSEFIDFKHLATWIISHQNFFEMFGMLAWAI